MRQADVVDKWMVDYLTKEDLVKIMEIAPQVPEGKKLGLPPDYVAELREKRKRHKEKIRMAKVERRERFGTSRMTQTEILARLVKESGPLVYSGRRIVGEDFVSATGSRRKAREAVAFRTNTGDTLLFTAGEAKTLKTQYGVAVPSEVFARKMKPRDARVVTLRDLW